MWEKRKGTFLESSLPPRGDWTLYVVLGSLAFYLVQLTSSLQLLDSARWEPYWWGGLLS